MRVATSTLYESVKYNLGIITEQMQKANEVVTTTKRINDISDDPVGLTQVLAIKSSLSQIGQLERNIAMGKTWLAASESALTQIQDVISDTKVLTVQMASATAGSAERSAAATTVQNTLDEMIALANTEVNGRYIFAGSKTDTTPFSGGGSYNGDNHSFNVKVGKDATLEVGKDGETVFQPSGAGANDDLFQVMSDLQTALQNNDISGIQDAMAKLDERFDHITAQISDVGSKTLRVESKEKILQDLDLYNQDRLSKLEDAEITEAIVELKMKEVAYQAALSAAAKILQVSLVDYV